MEFKSSIKTFFEMVVKFWPVIFFVVGALWAVLVFAGDKYIAGIAEEVYNNRVKAEPIIADIKTDMEVLKEKSANIEGRTSELKQSIDKLDGNIQQLIRIMLSEG